MQEFPWAHTFGGMRHALRFLRAHKKRVQTLNFRGLNPLVADDRCVYSSIIAEYGRLE